MAGILTSRDPEEIGAEEAAIKRPTISECIKKDISIEQKCSPQFLIAYS